MAMRRTSFLSLLNLSPPDIINKLKRHADEIITQSTELVLKRNSSPNKLMRIKQHVSLLIIVLVDHLQRINLEEKNTCSYVLIAGARFFEECYHFFEIKVSFLCLIPINRHDFVHKEMIYLRN